MSEMIERVARALFRNESSSDNQSPELDGWDGPLMGDAGRNMWRKTARVAIEATGVGITDIERLASGEFTLCDGYCHEQCGEP